MKSDNLRVVALGGCGGMGRFAVRTALSFSNIAEIVIADYNETEGRDFAEKCGDRTTFCHVDATSPSSLASVLTDADIVMTTVGPYYRFGLAVLHAAINAGCHYIDINDDWEPTLEMIALSPEAEQAGITALIGMGASPGISNLLAVKAADLFDKVDMLVTGWGAGIDYDQSNDQADLANNSAATEHWLHQLTGEIRLVKDGRMKDMPPFEEIRIDYPEIGSRKTHTVGHPEPVTLQRKYPHIKHGCNVMAMPNYVITILRWLTEKVDDGSLSISDAARSLSEFQGAKDLPPELLERFSKITPGSTPKPHLPAIFAYATGWKNGEKESIGASLNALPAGGMGGVTGIPLAVALGMLSQGMFTQTGVFTPEEVIDPDTFFDCLAPLCSPAYPSSRELVKINATFDF